MKTTSTEIVASIVKLAHGIRVSVVAGRVSVVAGEDAPQPVALQAPDCDVAQGDFLGVPVPAAVLAARVRQCAPSALTHGAN